MKLFLSVGLFLFSIQNAAAVSHYYPTLHKTQLENKELKGTELKKVLFSILAKKHIRLKNSDDILVHNCGAAPRKGKCYGQNNLGYTGARKVLFGKLHLEQGSAGYFIKDVYCRKIITNRDTKIGPNIIPNHSKLNSEHTWPQSKFSGRFQKSLQKSDLHHLYPTDSRANSIRGNQEFADVSGDPLQGGCEASYSGVPKVNGHNYFEPPSEHKGNVARALFYFSVRYQMKISSRQEAYLREWHIKDPVDANERQRNETIFKIQKNRNPFIDFPAIVENISDF